MMFRKIAPLLSLLVFFSWGAPVMAQLVGLPSPRLMTIMPMGGQVGTSVEVTVTGQYAEEISDLLVSTPKITAQPVKGADGKIVENKFLLKIAPDAPVGVHDVRVRSRLGISSPRAFSVSAFKELTAAPKSNNTLETAMALPVNSVCNAVMATRSIDFYSFEAARGKRIALECAAEGIDSRLTPVVMIADAEGRDLLVNRTGGVLDFLAPYDGKFIVKVNDLTYQGSDRHFYRLALQEVAADVLLPRHPATRRVSAMSWPPQGLSATAPDKEASEMGAVKKITLPCDISGSFFPAADVDTYEFAGKKGETWWIEIASERLGLATDPFVLVQKVDRKEGGPETFSDVAELYDIKSPVKLSSNGYSYDGPPYDVGSPDVLGKVEIKEDGIYQLQVRDLFGGTRNEPGNVYRLLVRKEAPDFALAAWAVHMTLRNGDRAAFSKPIALRVGAAMVFEVLAIRRDGFDGEIKLEMKDLPPGVTASGLHIPAGTSVGHVIITADENAKPGFSLASITGRATINEKEVTRSCQLATMEWPVRDAKQEIPAPRLVGNIPVSVSNSEKAPLSITAAEEKTWEAKVGETLKVPLKATWRGDFSGTSIKLKAYGTGFTRLKEFEIPLKAESHEAVLDLAALKVKPGDYTIAFYGGVVAKYRYNPAAVALAEAAQKKAEKEASDLAAEAKKLAAAAAGAPAEKKAEAEKAAKLAAENQKAAEAEKTKAIAHTKKVTTAANPKDIVDIVVSKPFRVSVKESPEVTAVTTAKK